MRRWTLVVLLVWCAATASAEEAAALKKLATLEAKFTRDEQKPDRPIVSIDLSGTSVTDADLRALGKLPSLKTMKLSRTKVTDAGLKWVARYKALENLDLQGTQVTDKGLTRLASLPELKDLNLCDTKVTDEGVAKLEKALMKRKGKQ